MLEMLSLALILCAPLIYVTARLLNKLSGIDVSPSKARRKLGRNWPWN
ncbi:hypothetical protein [Caballeronia grimmiae]|nr:hypothetical protein [Caballeronia grimmiae]